MSTRETVLPAASVSDALKSGPGRTDTFDKTRAPSDVSTTTVPAADAATSKLQSTVQNRAGRP